MRMSAFLSPLLCFFAGMIYALSVKSRFLFCCPERCDDLEAALNTTPEDIEENRTAKAKKERRLWYQYYLKPIVSEEHG